MRPLLLRPHHGLCLRFFRGEGYSGAFVENMARIHRRLSESPGQPVNLTLDADDICAACPHNRDGACESGQKVSVYDRAVLERCGLRPGEPLTWLEFSRLVQGRLLAPGLLHSICGDCQWYDLCRRIVEKSGMLE